MQTISAKIEKLNCSGIEQYIGKIDERIFQSSDANVLYYLFPLIEKTVLEILKLHSNVDVEINEQGTYRTLNSLLEKSRNRKCFSKKILEKLHVYFDNAGLRNELMHYTPELDELKIGLNELNTVKDLSLFLLNQLSRLARKDQMRQPENTELL